MKRLIFYPLLAGFYFGFVIVAFFLIRDIALPVGSGSVWVVQESANDIYANWETRGAKVVRVEAAASLLYDADCDWVGGEYGCGEIRSSCHLVYDIGRFLDKSCAGADPLCKLKSVSTPEYPIKYTLSLYEADYSFIRNGFDPPFIELDTVEFYLPPSQGNSEGGESEVLCW